MAKGEDKKYQAKQVIEPEKLTISVGFALYLDRQPVNFSDYCLHLKQTY
jgi:hypothetical protein